MAEAARTLADPEKERRTERWERRHLGRRRQLHRAERSGGRAEEVGARGKKEWAGGAAGRQAVTDEGGDGASAIRGKRGPSRCGWATGGQGRARRACGGAERRRQVKLEALWATQEG